MKLDSWATGYLIFGLIVCLWFGVAAAYGWKAPKLGIGGSSGSSSGYYSGGRSSGGFWGGGK